MAIVTLHRTAGVRNSLVSIVAVFSLLVFGRLVMHAAGAWGDYADSRNVQQAAVGTQDMSSNVGGVTQSAAGTRMTADRARVAAETVTGQAQALRGDVERFLTKIRAV